jgi:hypothetical protein
MLAYIRTVCNVLGKLETCYDLLLHIRFYFLVTIRHRRMRRNYIVAYRVDDVQANVETGVDLDFNGYFPIYTFSDKELG